MTGSDSSEPSPEVSPPDRSDAWTGPDNEVQPEMSIRWESDKSGVWWTTPEGDPLASSEPPPPNQHQPTEVMSGAGPSKPRRSIAIGLISLAVILCAITGVGVARQVLAGSGDMAERRPPVAPVTSASPGLAAGGSSSEPVAPSESHDAITPQRADFSSALRETRAAVGQVIASTCVGSGVGTGFFIGSDLVVASYPSVAESVATVVQLGDEVIPAQVIGADPESGVALLRLTRSADREALPIASADAASGTKVLSVGVPFRTDGVKGFESTLVASGSSVEFLGTTIGALAALSGSNDRGLSGAPVVTSSGEVVGAVLALPSTPGRWVVGAEQLSAGIERARSQPAPEAACEKPTGPHSDTRIKGKASKKLKKGLSGYFRGINNGDEGAAWRNMGPAFHTSRYSLRSFDWSSTYDFDITVHKTWTSGGQRRAWVTFVAINAPSRAPKGLEGEWCARWSFDYAFSDGGDRYLLNGNDGHDGAKIKMKRC